LRVARMDLVGENDGPDAAIKKKATRAIIGA
jgi:hypothetical protein